MSRDETTSDKPDSEDWVLFGMGTATAAAMTLIMPWWTLVAGGVGAVLRGIWSLWRSTQQGSRR